jgi:hypothetical protein
MADRAITHLHTAGGFTVDIFRREAREYFATPIGPVLRGVSALLFALRVMARDPESLMEPVFRVSGFLPVPELAQHATGLRCGWDSAGWRRPACFR